jgi:polyphosphate kinase
MLIFENGGDREVFLASADFMPRNFDTRVETIFPVYEPGLRDELVNYFDIQWSDNTKARILDRNLTNEYRPGKKGKRVRAQFDLEDSLRKLNS